MRHLENVEEIFTDLKLMLGKLGKASYEKNMVKFRQEHGHFIDEMIGYIKTAEDESSAINEVAATFVNGISEAFSVNGKIKGRQQADMNLYMIYYVFPAILLTDEECADKLCTGIKEKWNATFADTNISYTTYDKLYEAFREKIFGMF